MSQGNTVVALDIGTSKVAAVAAVNSAEGLEVVSLAYMPSAGVKKGTIEDLASNATVVDDVLTKIERHLRFKIENVWLNVPSGGLLSMNGQAVQHLYPSPRAVKRQDVHSLIQQSRKIALPPDRETVLAIPRDFLVDGARHSRQPIGVSSSRLECVTHIVSAPSGHIVSAERTVQAGNRKVAGMVPAAMASGLGVLTPEGRDLGAVLVDIGGGKTDIGVFVDGVLAFQSVVPIGGSNVTRDIQQLLQTDFDEAERLKAEFAVAVSGNVSKNETVDVTQVGQDHARPMQRVVLCQIVESRLKEIFDHVGHALEQSGLGPDIPKMAVLTGGGSILAGTEDLFALHLGHFKCKVAQPKVVGRFKSQVSSPMLSTAVGVARYSMESEGDEFAPVSGVSSWKDRVLNWISKI